MFPLMGSVQVPSAAEYNQAWMVKVNRDSLFSLLKSVEKMYSLKTSLNLTRVTSST